MLYPVQAYLDGEYSVGDVVDVQIIDFGKDRYKGVIMVDICEKVNETIDEEESKKACLYDFCYNYEETDERDGWLVEGKNQDVYLETVEDPTKQRKVLS